MARMAMVLATLAVAATATAQPFVTGEIVVVGRRTADNHGVLAVFRADGTLARTLVDQPKLDVAGELGFRGDGLLHAGASTVVIFNPDGTPLRSLPQEMPSSVEAMTFARDGRTYALWQPNRLAIFSADGTRLSALDLPGAVQSIDLATDQCTLSFAVVGAPSADESAVARVNLCALGAPVQYVRVYAVGQEPPREVRLLSGGQLLVARGLAGVEMLNTAGNVIRTFPTPAAEVALAPDGRSFYAALGSAPIRQIDLITGAELRVIATGINVSGLAVAGETRAAFDAGDIPLAGAPALLLLAGLLAAGALVVLRR